MAFTAKDVQALREMTGVGMMDCKKALTAADGDKDKAIEWLREKGLAAQTKKAGKVAAEGVSYAIVNEAGVGVVVEVNSQTDFVAKNEVFQGFVKDVASVIAAEDPADVAALQEMTYPGTDRTIASVTADKVLSIGENIQIRRFVRYAEGVNVPYIHVGGKVGVLVNLAVEGIADMAKVEMCIRDRGGGPLYPLGPGAAVWGGHHPGGAGAPASGTAPPPVREARNGKGPPVTDRRAFPYEGNKKGGGQRARSSQKFMRIWATSARVAVPAGSR